MYFDLHLRRYDLNPQAPTALFSRLRQDLQPAFFWDPAADWEQGPLRMALGGWVYASEPHIDFQWISSPPNDLQEQGGLLHYVQAPGQVWTWVPAFWLRVLDDGLEVLAQTPQGQNPDFWALERQFQQIAPAPEPFQFLGPWEGYLSQEAENELLAQALTACLSGQFDWLQLPRCQVAAYQGEAWTRFRQMRQRHNFFHSFYLESLDFQVFGLATHRSLRVLGSHASLQLQAAAWGRSGQDRHDWQRASELSQQAHIQTPHQAKVRAWQNHLQHWGQLAEAFPLLETQFSQTLVLAQSQFQLQAFDTLHTGLDWALALHQGPFLGGPEAQAWWQAQGQNQGYFGQVLLHQDAQNQHRAFFMERLAWAAQGQLHTCLPLQIHAHTQPQVQAAETQRYAQTAMF